MNPVAAIRERFESVDLIRGIVMVLMALDHVRGYLFTGDYDPLDLKATSASVFATRWITHFCAPTFVLLTGTAAYLSRARGRSTHDLAGLLVTRGLWLIVLELTVLHVAWRFDLALYEANLGVIWVIGLSMVVLAGLIYLPTWAVVALGAALVLGHNAFDQIEPANSAGWQGWNRAWIVLHGYTGFRMGPTMIHVGYALIPWVGVMALGWGLGALLQRPRETRRRALFILGTAAVLAFALLRFSNVYGNWEVWSVQRTPLWTVLSFLRCEKYPPSLLFLLVTLGPALLTLAWLDRSKPVAPSHPLIVFGRVPLFYYILHLFLIHAIAVGLVWLTYGRGESMFHTAPKGSLGDLISKPSGYGFSLGTVYLVWIGVVAALFPLCAWFARVKRRRRDWWLSYL